MAKPVFWTRKTVATISDDELKEKYQETLIIKERVIKQGKHPYNANGLLALLEEEANRRGLQL